MAGYSELPEHVRRIVERDGQVQFTPPSFERWLGRLYMLRTSTSMAAFILVWLLSYEAGHPWETATVRGIIAAIVFHFFAWAIGLFLFGELYDAEVKRARRELEEKERERSRRIEEYYRERLQAMSSSEEYGGGTTPLAPPASAGPPSYAGAAPSYGQPEPQRYAA